MDGPDVQGTWERVAPAWERHRARLNESAAAVATWLVDNVGAADGATILEITGGTGEVSFLAAERGARVIHSDFAPSMVEAARRGAAERGLDLDCRVIDAQRMDLPDESVDGVMSRYGMMLIPGQAMAFLEVQRVLRPGGRFAYAVWGPAGENLWILMLGLSVIQGGLQIPGDPNEPGGMFSLSTPERNREALENAAFTDVRVETLIREQTYDSFEDFWTFQTEVAGPIAEVLATASDEQIRAIEEAARANVADFARPDGSLAFPSCTLVVRATRA